MTINSATPVPDTELYQSLAASVYDRFPAPDYTQVLQLIDSLKPGRGHAFDVGCGTGTLISLLNDKGWNASGCDPSEAMVRIARNKNPQADVQFANTRNFSAPRPMDLITCTFDVMNHLQTLEDAGHFFTKSRNALSSNGVLIFDTVTPNDIKYNWPRYAHIESRSNELIAIRGEKVDALTGRLHYDFFVKNADGLYSRSSEIHTLRVLPLAWTFKALRIAGFSKVQRYDAMTLEKPSRNTVRWIFAALKGATVR